MNIPINHFEQYIDETILKRGLDYFKSGAVDPPELVKKGRHEATVHGSENYTVRLDIENGEVVYHYCTCPYDFGPVCKHVAAVLLYMQQDALDIKPKKKSKSKKPRKKRKTLDDKVNDLLEELPKKEIAGFLKNLTEEDRGLRRRFLASFAHRDEDESKALYARQVKAILKSAPSSHGFIEWHATAQVGTAVYRLIQNGKEQLEKGNHRTAFYMAFAVLEEMTRAFDFMDDSNADIGSNIDAAMDVLGRLAESDLNEELRKEFLALCLTDFKKALFKGWNWHLEMLHLVSLLAKNKKESSQALDLLSTMEFSRYEKEEAETIKVNLLTTIEGKEFAQKYVLEHLENSRFRRLALKKYMAEKDFEKAAQIAQDGYGKDKKDLPGLAMEWRDWQLRIAIAAADTEDIIKYARLLILESFNRDAMEYHQILKDHVPSKEWPDFLNTLVSEMRPTYTNINRVAKFYVEEAWWDKLFDILKEAHSVELFKSYEQYLVEDYTTELAIIYEDHIRRYLSRNTGRNYYKEAVRKIRWIVKLGDQDRADTLIGFLRKEYGNRPALMEELDRV